MNYTPAGRLEDVTDSAPSPSRDYGFKPNAAAADYVYDANGNMIYDPHKELTFIYNHLNLPESITRGTELTQEFVYDATGRKWQKTTISPALSEDRIYLGGVEIVNKGNGPQVEAIYEGSGRIVSEFDATGSTVIGAHTEYFHADHLGNNRLTFSDLNTDGQIAISDDPNTPEDDIEIAQENHYYPFGLSQDGYWYGSVDPQNNYRYNGKELDEATGLYDYGARYYDPAIARWNAVDPLADEYANISPYVYVANNPLIYIDPDGKRIFFIGGAGNDVDGWDYIPRWLGFMSDAGLRNPVRVDASAGKSGDVRFTGMSRRRYYRNDPHNWHAAGAVNTAKEQILSNLDDSPLGSGEQFNLIGYSFGSTLQAQVALDLASEGHVIDNLILVGSPIPDDSELYQNLLDSDNILNVIRVDIEGDLLSNPQNTAEWLKGAVQNSSDDGPHFDLARPGDEVDAAIRSVIEWLQSQGVE